MRLIKYLGSYFFPINGENIVQQMSQHTHSQRNLIEILIKPNEPSYRLFFYKGTERNQVQCSLDRHCIEMLCKITDH